MDISLPTVTSLGGKHHWLLAVYDKSDYTWSFFLKEKSYFMITVIGLIKDLKAKHGIEMEWICCNNAGENKAFENLYKKNVWASQ